MTGDHDPVEAQPRALSDEIRACRRCADAFLAVKTQHTPRPVFQFGPSARILIAGQAPGWRAHSRGMPFDDPSGDRLRAWLGVNRAQFYDSTRFAILPMAFCFPGHDAKGGDKPPPRLCSETWRAKAVAAHPNLELIIVIGRYALAWHAPETKNLSLSAIVADWRARLSSKATPTIFPTPHPSWRNNAWLKRNPWFEAEAAPALSLRVAQILENGT